MVPDYDEHGRARKVIHRKSVNGIMNSEFKLIPGTERPRQPVAGIQNAGRWCSQWRRDRHGDMRIQSHQGHSGNRLAEGDLQTIHLEIRPSDTIQND